MKKILCVILAMLLLFSLCACGGNKDDGVGNGSDATIVTPGDEVGSEVGGETPKGIRENGELPANKDDLTDEEYQYYKSMVIEAVLKLDMNVLYEYTDEGSYTSLKMINDDPQMAELYKKTIGSSIYLKESDAFVTKSTDYVYSKWYTDCYKGSTIQFDNVKEHTRDYIDKVYEDYYKDAPYTTGKVGGFSCDIVDGCIKFGVNSIFQYVHVYQLKNFETYAITDGDGYACLVFGDNGQNLNLGYNYIDENLPVWKSLYKFDVDGLIDYANKNPDCTDGIYGQTINEYYKDAGKRKIIEDWVKENCEIYRGLSSVYVYTKAYVKHDTIETTFPYNTYTEAEQELIKDLNLCQRILCQNDSNKGIGAFYDIVKTMKSTKAID